MSDGAELGDSTDLYEALLDEVSLRRYAEDLRACASDLSLSVKASPTAMAEPEERDLDGTLGALGRGEVRAVQIRYRFEGDPWCDTLVHGPRGIRLLRSRLDLDDP